MAGRRTPGRDRHRYRPSSAARRWRTPDGAQLSRVLDETGRLRLVLEDQQARIDRRSSVT